MAIIFWTPTSLHGLEDTIVYLQNNFTDKEIKKLAGKIESFTETISHNPYLFPKSEYPQSNYSQIQHDLLPYNK